MVRQKCLDLISNVATVPDVAYKIMRHQSWFLDHLLIMLRDGDIVSDKIPALSVLIRLLKVMLTERMISSYMKLVDMQYIDCLVDIFENPKFTHTTDILPFFIKFEFITMQSLTVILGDAEYSQFWSDKAKYAFNPSFFFCFFLNKIKSINCISLKEPVYSITV